MMNCARRWQGLLDETGLPCEQRQKMIVLRRQRKVAAMACQAGDDAAMFPHQTRRLKGLTEEAPLQHGIRCNSGLFFLRQGMHRGGEGPNGLLHAFIWRGQFEFSIEDFQMTAKLFL